MPDELIPWSHDFDAAARQAAEAARRVLIDFTAAPL